MPIYEYECVNKECREITEKMRKISEFDVPLSCPLCGSETRKKVSQTSFSLKGGGWASDGYSG